MKKRMAVGLFFYSITTFANPIGIVLSTLGNVFANGNHIQRTLTRGSAIESGDVIITGAHAQAKIKYNNGTLVSINPNSNYQVSSKASDQYDATLNVGSIGYSSTGKKKQGVLHTPVVALAILGTEFTASVTPPPHTVTLDVSLGQVQVGSGQVVNSGYNAVISPDGKVTISPDSKHHDPLYNVLTINPQLITTATSSTVITTANLAQFATISIGCP